MANEVFVRGLIASLVLIAGTVAGATPAAAATLSVDEITAVRAAATADGTFEHGWKWVFDITVPEEETVLAFKFADWTHEESVVPVAGNVRYYSAQSTDAFDAEHALTLSQSGAYDSASLHLDSAMDLDPLADGRQIQVAVEVKISSGTPSGSYSTQYGVRTDADAPLPPVEDETLTVSDSAENPDASILEVRADAASDWYTVFAFELDAEGAAIALDTVEIVLDTADAPATDVVESAKLVIGGEEFSDFEWSSEGDAASTVFAVGKNFTVGEGQTVTATYLVRFKAQNGNYDVGEAFMASTEGALIKGEGANPLTAEGAATGSIFLLATPDLIVVEPVQDSATVTVVDGPANDYATFEVKVDVTALAADLYIAGNGSAFTYQIEDGVGAATAVGTRSVAVASAADATGAGNFVVQEGQTETFTFRVTLAPGGAAGNYRMQLLSMLYDDADSADHADDTALPAAPAGDYETDFVLIAS